MVLRSYAGPTEETKKGLLTILISFKIKNVEILCLQIENATNETIGPNTYKNKIRNQAADI